MQVRDTPHQTGTFSMCKGFWCSCYGSSESQYRNFCFFTIPHKWKWDSSPVIKTISYVSNSKIAFANLGRLMSSFYSSIWKMIIPYEWKWRSKFKEYSSEERVRDTEWRELASRACHTLKIFPGFVQIDHVSVQYLGSKYLVLWQLFTYFIMVFRIGTRPRWPK